MGPGLGKSVDGAWSWVDLSTNAGVGRLGKKTRITHFVLSGCSV